MIKINLSPVRSDKVQSRVTWEDPILTVDGVSYDMSELPDGATALHPVLGNVSRTGNDYEIKIIITHGMNAPYETRFPEPIIVNVNGEVSLPKYNEDI